MNGVCSHCNGAGVTTNENGIQSDEPCGYCGGDGASPQREYEADDKDDQ